MNECPHCRKKFFPTKADPDHCPHCGGEIGTPQAYRAPARPKRKARNLAIAGIVAALLTLYVVSRIGFYTISPADAPPLGVTWLVWRVAGEPLYNSPEGTCLRVTGEITPLCHAAALAGAPMGRIIARFSYQVDMHQKSLQP